ncbi:MAG: hypothetical protein Q8O67_18935 [Deltaproteobacteria bacterium]|nr:hypothetical protein [Deltaproteobacteria bacterium]
MKRAALVVVAVIGCSSSCICAAPAPAPEGLEDLARFIWDRFEIKEDTDVALQDQELHAAFINLDEELAKLEVDDDTPFKSVLQDIDQDRVKDLEGMADRSDKIGLAQGLVVANIVHCTLEQNENITLSEKSAEIHGDVYTKYEKEFDDDIGPFDDGDSDQIFWRLNYTIGSPPVGSPYSAETRAAARRVKAIDDETSPFGDLFLTRVHLPQPAEFEGDGSQFDLDFQLETYHQREDGNLIHFYAMWRRMVLGPVDSSQEIFINTSLDGMVDWDKETEVACGDGRADD